MDRNHYRRISRGRAGLGARKIRYIQSGHSRPGSETPEKREIELRKKPAFFMEVVFLWENIHIL